MEQNLVVGYLADNPINTLDNSEEDLNNLEKKIN
jgi:hypothetical protein